VMVLDTLIVRQPGLQAMARSGADYVFTDQDSTTALQRLGNNNHFMTPDTAAAFLDLFAEVRGNLASQDRYWINRGFSRDGWAARHCRVPVASSTCTAPVGNPRRCRIQFVPHGIAPHRVRGGVQSERQLPSLRQRAAAS
jgi:hypothetical protein